MSTPASLPPDPVIPDPVTPGLVEETCRALRAAGPELRLRPAGELAEVLGGVGTRFLTEGDSLRTEALEGLPDEAGLSREMARAVLDGMARDWTAPRLLRTLEAEFGDPRCLDGPVGADGWGGIDEAGVAEGRGEVHRMAFGPELCLQVVSGSVPGVGVHALLRSLLVKAPTLIKPGAGDALLPRLFARGLEEANPGLARALAVRYWPGGSTELEAAALAETDVVVVYGSDETVGQLRAAAPATTRVVGYHHRVGVAVVGREVLTESAVASTATDLARAVALFEQRGCVCPHFVWVERGGEVSPEAFAQVLARAFQSLEAVLPSAALDAREGGALQQLRGTSEMQAALEGGVVLHGGAEAPWTVIYEPERRAGLPTLGRGVRLRPVDDAGRVAGLVAPLGPHLQSVGHAGLGVRLSAIGAALGRAGASRVVPLSELPFPQPWWLHDGRGPLRELVRWVEIAGE